uniref:Fc receptor, IgA, IgM, high affinity n=1 Tax=Nannospalax galili TaxID=1026970 RepID=A0A8C6RGI2_NANGA
MSKGKVTLLAVTKPSVPTLESGQSSSFPGQAALPALSTVRFHSESLLTRLPWVSCLCFQILQVTSQTTRWEIFLLLCLLHGSSMTPPTRKPHFRWLQAGSLPSKTYLCTMASNTSSPCWWPENASTLRGPRLVSGEPGGTVTIQCHYVPTSVNRHQRKYWCRLEPPLWICRTIVSTNHYTHHDYHGRVALTDFPHSGLFVVRLFQLSLGDMGPYRCGIGDRNNMLFFNMNLTVFAGPSSTISAASSAPGQFITVSFGITAPAANKWTLGTTQFLEGKGSEWDRIAPTTVTSKIIPSVKGRQTPRTTRTTVLETSSREVGSVKAIVPTAESPASEPRSIPTTLESVWIWGTRSSVTIRASKSEGGRTKTTSETKRPQEETEVTISTDTVRKTTGTTRPSALISEHVAWETLPEGTVVSKQQALYSTEESSLTPGAWALNTTHVEVASVEGSITGSLGSTPEENGPPAKPSQLPASGPKWSPGNGSKSAYPAQNPHSLLYVSAALKTEMAPRVTLIRMTYFLEPTLPDVGKNLPPTQAILTVLEDPGP